MEPRNSNNDTHTHSTPPHFSRHTPTPLTHNTPTYPSLDPPQRPTFNTTTNHLSAQAPTMQLHPDGAQALTNLLNTLGPNLAPDNKQIDFQHLTQTYTQPRMTQHELKQFANARNVSKSQLDNFVERLQNLFNASYNDPDAMAEAKALRILHNNLDYRRLTPLCQAYVDPTASFAAPRTHYWRFTHHIHLDECITRGPDNVDLATAIDRMGRNFNRAMQTMNDNTRNYRRRDNDNRNRRDNDNRNRRTQQLQHIKFTQLQLKQQKLSAFIKLQLQQPLKQLQTTGTTLLKQHKLFKQQLFSQSTTIRNKHLA